MSTKATIVNLPCCHIYEDSGHLSNPPTLCVDVQYGYVGEMDSIKVMEGSDFSKILRYLLKGKTQEELKAVLSDSEE